MTSLTVEMGLRRRRGDSPPMPEQIASRDDMTLAQKQRLAVLAKMGVGPVASPVERPAPQLRERERALAGPPPVDRRAALLERERRLREQEEKWREEEERLEEERRKKKAVKPLPGLARLGPVLPREEDIPQFLPAPAREPEPRRYRDGTGENARASSSAQEGGEEESDEADAAQRPQQAAKQERKRQQQQQEAQRQGQGQVQGQVPGAKKKKKRGKEEGWEEWQGDEEDWEDEVEMPKESPMQRKRPVDGGISKQTMVVESVKGKVSHANKNLTDADLERRFGVHDSSRDGSSLMTEEEVLRLIRKERKERGPAGSAARRVQRELAEWESAKEVQRARVKSPHRFERMVVARK